MDSSIATNAPASSRVAPPLQPLLVPIDSVKPHPQNPRRGDIDAIAASLGRFSQQKPIVVQRSTGFILAGNHIWRAAKKLGWDSIAANVVELDDASATGFLLADNRVGDLGGYDEALLAAILAEQQAAANLAATGYDADAVAAILAAAGRAAETDPDAAAALPERNELYVKPGELWTLGVHRLLVGDCTEPANVSRLMAGDTADLVWTDPPYGCDYTGKTGAALKIANDALGAQGTRDLLARALSAAPLRPGGAFYIASPAGPDLHAAFLAGIADAGLSARQTLVWLKNCVVIGHSDYSYRHENLVYGWRPGGPHRFRGGRDQSSVWEIDRPSRNDQHPTAKPVELVARAIRNSTRAGEIVYDPFSGGGTTTIAAEQTERIARALELDPRYAQAAIERFAAFHRQAAGPGELAMSKTPGRAQPAPSPVVMPTSVAVPVRGRRSERDLSALRDRIELLMLGGLTTAPAIHRALAGPESPAPLALSERAVRAHMRAVERRWAERARSAELDVERGRVIASLEEQARTAARRSALNANDTVGVGYARVQLAATEQLIVMRGLAAPARAELSGPAGAPLAIALTDHPADHHSAAEVTRRMRNLLAEAEAEAEANGQGPDGAQPAARGRQP